MLDFNAKLPDEITTSFFGKLRNPKFTGRSKELATIDHLLSTSVTQDDDQPCKVVVHGLGGVGKTQLVSEYCHQARQMKDTFILWFTASAAGMLQSQYREGVETLRRLAPKNGVIKDLVDTFDGPGLETKLIKTWLLKRQNWILVMDNFDTVSIDIHRFIPSGRHGKVIFTSRDRRSIETVRGRGFELESPGSFDAELQFLRQRNSIEYIPPQQLQQLPEYPSIKQIVKDLQGFPLALSQAAAYIRENDPLTYSDYLDLLTARREDREVLLRFKEANPEYPESVMTTWEISLDHVKTKRPDAASLLQMLGFFAQSEISESVLWKACLGNIWFFGTFQGIRRLSQEQCEQLHFLGNRAQFHHHVGFLISLSLVSKDRNGNISVHPLVHEWIRARLRPYPSDAARFAWLCALVIFQAYPLHQHGTSVMEPYLSFKNIDSPQLHLHLREVLLNFGQYAREPTNPVTPVEVRILLFALLQSTVAFHSNSPGAKIRDFVRKYPFLMDLPEDDFGSLQRRSFRAVLSSESLVVSDPSLLNSLSERGTDMSQSSPRKSPRPKDIEVILFTSFLFTLVDTKYSLVAQEALLGLLSFLSNQGDPLNRELMFIKLLVKCQLGRVLPCDKYWQLPGQFLIDKLTCESFRDVILNDSMAYFCACAQQHKHDLGGLRVAICVFAKKARLWHEMNSLKDPNLAPGSRYISNSFGRYSVDLVNGTIAKGEIAASCGNIAASCEELWKQSLVCVDFTLDRRGLSAPEDVKKGDATLDDLESFLNALLTSVILPYYPLEEKIGAVKQRYAVIHFLRRRYDLAIECIQIIFEADKVAKHFEWSNLRGALKSKLSVDDIDAALEKRGCLGLKRSAGYTTSAWSFSQKLKLSNKRPAELTIPLAHRHENHSQDVAENLRLRVLIRCLRHEINHDLLHIWIRCLGFLGKVDTVRQKKWHQEAARINKVVQKQKDMAKLLQESFNLQQFVDCARVILIHDLQAATGLSIRSHSVNRLPVLEEAELDDAACSDEEIEGEAPISSTGPYPSEDVFHMELSDVD